MKTREEMDAQQAAEVAGTVAYFSSVDASERALFPRLSPDERERYEAACDLKARAVPPRGWSRKAVLRAVLGHRWSTLLAEAGLEEDFQF